MEPSLFRARLGQGIEDTLAPPVPDLRIGFHLDGWESQPESSEPDRAEEDALDIPASWEEVVDEMRREGALSVEEREAREAERLRLRVK